MSTINVNAKTTKKINTINDVAKASVKAITLEKANAMLAKALEKSEGLTKDRAKALYAIKANKLYEGQAEDFKSYINDICGGVLYGVKYNQANNLSNMYNYVWCDKTLNVYDSNKANLLVAYVKKDYAKVISMHKKGVISETMKKADIEKALKKNFGGKSETVKAGAKNTKTSTINEDINVIEKIIEGYCTQLVKKGNCEKHYNDVRRAWNNILEELCR